MQTGLFDKPKNVTVKDWDDLKWFRKGGKEKMNKQLDYIIGHQIKMICPEQKDIYKAFELTPFDSVKVVLLGQDDPYPDPANAMGLSFSVPAGRPLPGSLINIFKEMEDDIGCRPPNGDLTPWARQGVLLLNTILTCEAYRSLSHTNLGWQELTTEAIRSLVYQRYGLVFILLGSQAIQNFYNSVSGLEKDLQNHTVLKAVHPSPRSAHGGFFGSKIFSRTNKALAEYGHNTIDWC